MTRISWLPVLILMLIHLRTTLSLDCVSQVKDCPCSEKEWEERSAFYNCSFSRYTCMLTFNNSLVEACIYNYPVRPGALGCPIIISCYERIAILAIETEFRPCPANKTGCPPTGHGGYSVANLYMYPECIKRSESPRCTDDMQITTEGGKNGSGAEILYITIIAVLTCVIVFAIVAGIIFKKRYRQKLIDYRYRQTPVDNNSAVSELAPSSVLPLVTDIEFEEMDNNSAVSELAPSSVSTLVTDIDIEEMGNNSADLELAPSSVLPLATDIDIKEIGRKLLRFLQTDIFLLKKTLDDVKKIRHEDKDRIINYMENVYTPLSQAVFTREKDIVVTLIREGADFEKLNESKENPIQQGIFHLGYEKWYRALPSKEETYTFLRSFPEQVGKDKIGEDNFEKLKNITEKVLQECKDVPREIWDMGHGELSNYRRNIKSGALPSNYIRCMVVGHYGVGKTTLVRGLLERNQDNIQSTDGIDVYREMCYIKDGEWKIQDKHQTFNTEDFFGLGNVIQVDFWDFAGQAIYYSTHPTYFSDRCLYLLVINAALGTTTEVDDKDMDPSRISRRQVMDFLMYWIGAIFYYSGRVTEGYPKIIIIGTHTDQVKNYSELKSVEMEIKRTFKEYLSSGQLIFSLDYFVNARSLTGGDRKNIRYLIQEEGISYPCFGDKVPKSWVDIQRKLRRDFRDKGVCILSVDELKNVCNDLGLSMKEDDYFLFLEFYTSLGQMLYFKESALKDHVILKPMWLINAMKILITQEARLKHAEKIGEITREGIQQCLSSEDQQYIKNIDHVLKVLDRLDLVCNPKTYDYFGSNLPAQFYYIPSIFKESGLIVPDPTYSKMEQITYSFEGQILPPAVYHRLVCSYMSRWKIHEKHLYCETVQFQIQDDILVRFRRQQHQFLVTLYFTGERGTDDIQDVTSRVHHYVLETVDRIVKTYTRSYESKSPSVHYEGNISLESNVTEIKKGSLFSPKKQRSLRGVVFSNTELEVPLTDIHLLMICMHLTLDQQTDLLQKLHEVGRPLMFQNTSNLLLIALNEWRTSIINSGNKCVAGSILGLVKEEVLYKALDPKKPEISFLPEKVKSRHVTDEFLDNVAYRIGTKYFLVGVSLGLEIDEVIVIVNDNPMQTLKINQEVLQNWSRKEIAMGRYATYGMLASVFVDANCRIDDFPIE